MIVWTLRFKQRQSLEKATNSSRTFERVNRYLTLRLQTFCQNAMELESLLYKMQCMEIGKFLIGFIFIKVDCQSRLKRLARDVFDSNDI